MRSHLAPGALVLAAALLSSCAAAPAYTQPVVALPPAFRHAAAAGPAPAATAAGERWWEAFADPVLTRTVDDALVGAPDLAIAAARLRQAAAGVRAAEAAKAPQIGFDVGVSHRSQSTEEPLGAFASRFPGYQRSNALIGLNGAASWEIDLFGGLSAGARAAQADLAGAEAGQAGARLTLAGEVANAYLDAREMQARLGIARARVLTLEGLDRIARLGAARGFAPQIDADAAAAELAGARSIVPALEAGLEVALNRIDVLSGRAPVEAAGRLGEGAIPVAPRVAVRDAPADLLTRRPDIVAAERTVAAADAETAQALAARYPRVTLSSLFGLVATGLPGLFTGGALQSNSGIGITGPLLSFGRTHARIEAARGRTDEAVARYRQAVLQAVADVENGLAALDDRAQIGAEAGAAEVALRRAHASAAAAYKAGVVSQAELLRAERRLEDAQDRAAQARADAARAAVTAYRALGGGWQAPAALAAAPDHSAAIRQ